MSQAHDSALESNSAVYDVLVLAPFVVLALSASRFDVAFGASEA